MTDKYVLLLVFLIFIFTKSSIESIKNEINHYILNSLQLFSTYLWLTVLLLIKFISKSKSKQVKTFVPESFWSLGKTRLFGFSFYAVQDHGHITCVDYELVITYTLEKRYLQLK
jgi:hypothetical protein